MLSALGDFCPLRPVEKIIAAAIDDRPRPSTGLQKGLRALRDSSILTFRAFNETYRIWEGSDIDIDERIAEGRRKLRGVFNLADAMQQFLPPKPVVARRHSFEGGALRFFEMVYVDDPGHRVVTAIAGRDGADRGMSCDGSGTCEAPRCCRFQGL